MSSLLVPLGLPLAAGLAVAVGLVLFMRARDRKMWAPLAAELGGEVASRGLSSYLKVMEAGVEARVFYQGKSRRPHFMTFELVHPFEAKIKFFVDDKPAHPKPGPRISDQLVLADPQLARQFEVRAEPLKAGLRFLEMPLRREALAHLFNADFIEVLIEKAGARASLYELDEESLTAKSIRAHLGAMIKLAAISE